MDCSLGARGSRTEDRGIRPGYEASARALLRCGRRDVGRGRGGMSAARGDVFVTASLIWAIALLGGLFPLLWVLVRADTMSRLIALEVASVNVALVFVLLCDWFNRSFYADEAIVVALMSLGGGFAFARMLE